MSVLEDEFKQKLEQQIKDDAPAQFPASGWDQIALEMYYPGVDPASSQTLVNSAVGTVLGRVLKRHDLCLTEQKLNQFFAGIFPKMTPAAAIKRMLLVAGMAVPCQSAGPGGAF